LDSEGVAATTVATVLAVMAMPACGDVVNGHSKRHVCREDANGDTGLTNAAAFGYTNFSTFVTATGAASSISFNFRDPQSFWLLDDVSVTAVRSHASIRA